MSQLTRFMGPACGPPGSCWPQMGPMLASWTLLSGMLHIYIYILRDFRKFPQGVFVGMRCIAICRFQIKRLPPWESFGVESRHILGVHTQGRGSIYYRTSENGPYSTDMVALENCADDHRVAVMGVFDEDIVLGQYFEIQMNDRCRMMAVKAVIGKEEGELYVIMLCHKIPYKVFWINDQGPGNR